MKVPDTLYHATLKENAEAIWYQGLFQNNEGLVYLADSAKGAASFLVTRCVALENIMVFEIDTTQLDKTLFAYGTDHNPNYFKGIEVYAYNGFIDSVCFDNIYTLTLQEEDNNDI